MAPVPSPTTTWHDNNYQSISSRRPELSVKGKSVVVTGGGTGIGAEVARSFAEAGASRVALLGRRQQPLLETKAGIEQEFPGVHVFVASTDVTNKDQVDAAFAQFAENGEIDIVVSGAAIHGPREPLKEVDGDKFSEAIQNLVRGALFVAQAFLRHAAVDAVAIDINSAAAHFNFAAEYGTYSIAKLAVFRLWDSIAFANPNLSIFHLQPGIVDTAMNREAGAVAATGRSDDVSLPGNFCVWLASPEAQFLKGKFLWANWDVDELKARAEEIQQGTLLEVGLVGWPFGQEGFALHVKF